MRKKDRGGGKEEEKEILVIYREEVTVRERGGRETNNKIERKKYGKRH
jgi:hypothetical protein